MSFNGEEYEENIANAIKEIVVVSIQSGNGLGVRKRKRKKEKVRKEKARKENVREEKQQRKKENKKKYYIQLNASCNSKRPITI